MNPIAQTLIIMLDNQRRRTHAAFEDMKPDTFMASPCADSDCHTIQQIGRHLVGLRGFGLLILESPLAEKMPPTDAADSPAQCADRIETASALLAEAIEQYNADDWLTPPPSPREGKWGDEATLLRLMRPLNDLTNHLGAVRAIRRMTGDPAEHTQ